MSMPPLPNSGVPPSALSYGPDSSLYPNLQPHFQSGPHPGGIIPPIAPQVMPQPHPTYPSSDSAHKPFPIPCTPACPDTLHTYSVSPSDYLSEKDKRKIAKAEYKADKKVYKAQKKAEKKAAKRERKALKKHGIPTGAVIGAGVGVVGAAALTYAAIEHARNCSSSSSCSSCSSSSSD